MTLRPPTFMRQLSCLTSLQSGLDVFWSTREVSDLGAVAVAIDGGLLLVPFWQLNETGFRLAYLVLVLT